MNTFHTLLNLLQWLITQRLINFINLFYQIFINLWFLFIFIYLFGILFDFNFIKFSSFYTTLIFLSNLLRFFFLLFFLSCLSHILLGFLVFSLVYIFNFWAFLNLFSSFSQCHLLHIFYFQSNFVICDEFSTVSKKPLPSSQI